MLDTQIVMMERWQKSDDQAAVSSARVQCCTTSEEYHLLRTRMLMIWPLGVSAFNVEWESAGGLTPCLQRGVWRIRARRSRHALHDGLFAGHLSGHFLSASMTR